MKKKIIIKHEQYYHETNSYNEERIVKMYKTPKFRAEESWDNSGNVDVWFFNDSTGDVREIVGDKLEYFLNQLNDDERTVFHLEAVIDGIFNKMKNNGELVVKNNKWSIRNR